MHTMAAQVGDRAHEVPGQFSLHREAPLFDICVLAISLFGVWREGSRAGEIGIDWIAELEARSAFHRIGGNFVFSRQILIVQLSIFVVDTESASNHGFAVVPRRPCKGDTGINIAMVLLAE